MKFKLRKANRSLRTILIVWFLFFSITPMAFITGYSIVKYERGIDNELSQRLMGNAREIVFILADFQKSLELRREKFIKDSNFINYIATENRDSLNALGRSWLKTDISSNITFFNKSGKMLLSLTKGANGEIQTFTPTAKETLFISDQNYSQALNSKEHLFVDYDESNKETFSLILLSQILGNRKKIVGFLEQDVSLNQRLLKKLQERLKTEIIILRGNGQIISSTHADLMLYKPEHLQKHLNNQSATAFDLTIRGEPYGFITYPLFWGKSGFFVALGASKSESRSELKRINWAFYSVVSLIVILLILTIILTSNIVLKPLEDLVIATQKMTDTEQTFEIPIKSDTEIGLLTESFNEMSRHIIKARNDLKNKISELEKTNKELTETQSQLVHSSKMVSLGQLVAGVAHELNNPIGFIYSNMSLLHDYSERLLKLVEIAEREPEKIKQSKEDFDIDYIKQDLPKLVASCQDGARRTKDIVLGLRNFSRLEKTEIGEMDLHSSIDNTLILLGGEMKSRITVHKSYDYAVPKITCYASQLNQVFMNLLTNAIQAIKEKGEIWITTHYQPHLENGDFVSISIQDSGEGMKPEIMDKIFDPFFSTKSVGQGTGLGLSITYGIVHNHGGSISVKSSEAVGTEFIIKLPINTRLKQTQLS